MKSFALITLMWALAIITVVLLNSEHHRPNAGLPVVKGAAEHPVWTLTPQCPVTSRNLRRYVERIA